jgi:hypothetical protein
VSGFILRAGDSAIMTAPSFTHQNAVAVALPFFPISPNAELIDWTLARLPLRSVSAILVGHSHYDHLLDVPYVARTHATAATIYGSPTTANILAPVAELRGRVHAIPLDSIGSANRAGEWYRLAGGRFRVMALESSHAPNFWHYTYADAVDREPRTSLPRTAHGWHLGEVYAYLIDVLDAGGAPVFRIYYQDAAAEPEYSVMPPLSPGDRHGVDLAIICAGNYENATNYPTPLLANVAPRRVIVSHWEDFFRTLYPPFKGIWLNDAHELARRLDAGAQGRWVTPEPMAEMVFRF